MNEQQQEKAEVIPIDKSQRAGAKFTISATIDGFPIVVELEGKADSLRAMIQKLQSIGATPPTSLSQTSPVATPSANDAPVCEFHGQMKKGNYGWFCPKKMGDGSYCKSKA